MTRGGWCCIRDGCISMSRAGDEHGPLVDLGRERPQLPARARNLSPMVPRVIIARVQRGTVPDLAALRSRVMQVAPSASVDDHRAWIERMRSMTGATVFAGIGILALVIIATIISVSFATRGAMAANRPIVEVLHFVGAGDRYIANRFLRHFLRLGLEGGVIGGGAAMLGFGFSDSMAGWFSGTPVGDQFRAQLATLSLRPSGSRVRPS